jgi:antitoxin (DNA-binding transcriptional repressor) of toxin-antitoxin stability system
MIAGLLTDVEKSAATVIIVRGNRPVARIVPAQKRRVIRKLPSLACKIDPADLCSDDSEMWNACNA